MMQLPSNTTVNVLSTQITLSALSVFIIQKLKSSSWAPWFSQQSDKLNKAANGILAFISAIGIHVAWSHGALPGTYMIQVSGMTLLGIGAGLWAVTKSLVFNEIIYRTTVKSQVPGGPPRVLAAPVAKDTASEAPKP